MITALPRIMQMMLSLLIFSTYAQDRKAENPNLAFTRRAGLVTQLEAVYANGLPENERRLAGDGTIISPCHIITNYHVAFGKSRRTDNQKIVMVNDRVKGHVVNFAFDVGESGEFKSVARVKVVGFANYIKSDFGVTGDMAVLQFENCLNDSQYPPLELSLSDSQSNVPIGSLMTVSTNSLTDGRNQIVVQQGCKSELSTPIDGLFIADCEDRSGMSGSAVYELGSDNKWRWTGLHAAGNGQNRTIAISAKTIAAFLKSSALGPYHHK